MVETRNVYKILSENLKGRDYSEDPYLDGNIILHWILGKYMGRCRKDVSGSRKGPVVEPFEHENELSGFTKCEAFAD
jgi:hypothetical protein